MAASLNRFIFRKELSSAINERLEKRYRDEWIDSQHELNVVVGLVSRRDPSLRQIKVIQNFHCTLDIGHFLDSLAGSFVTTLAFVGINMDDDYCSKLAAAISASESSLSCLQLCRIVPTGLPQICPAISRSSSLKELRLTFNHDLSQEHVALLMKSLGESTNLEIFKLYCVDLENETNLLTDAVRSAQGLKDLRITSCNLKDITSLARAIKESNRITRLDLSMNRISDTKAVADLWDCPTITYLSVSQNELGSEELTEETSDDVQQRQFIRLAENKSLLKLYLDMNPLSPGFVACFTKALEQNYTLRRLGLLTLTVNSDAARKLRYLVALNCAGRGRMQDFPNPALFPKLLSRVAREPELIYGLITQAPHVWCATTHQGGLNVNVHK